LHIAFLINRKERRGHKVVFMNLLHLIFLQFSIQDESPNQEEESKTCQKNHTDPVE